MDELSILLPKAKPPTVNPSSTILFSPVHQNFPHYWFISISIQNIPFFF